MHRPHVGDIEIRGTGGFIRWGEGRDDGLQHRDIHQGSEQAAVDAPAYPPKGDRAGLHHNTGEAGPDVFEREAKLAIEGQRGEALALLLDGLSARARVHAMRILAWESGTGAANMAGGTADGGLGGKDFVT